MTKTEIIEETAAFYNSGNRSTKEEIGGNNCAYLGDNGKRCAFSRCCIDSPEVNEFLDENEGGNANDLINTAEEEGIEILKPEYRGHSSKFWQQLQSFHDLSFNWNENGLTASGIEKKNDLIRAFS